jgi:hypothetical protein
MRIEVSPRAATILYRLLVMVDADLPFLVPANVCRAVIDTFHAARRNFVLVDIDAATLSISAAACTSILQRQRCAGVLYVHPYGSARSAEPLFGAVRAVQSGLITIDDRCLCRPDVEPGEVGADVTLFSTGRSKDVDLGGGGYAFLREHVPVASGALPDWLSGDVTSWEVYRGRIIEALRTVDDHKERLNAIYTADVPAESQLAPEFQRWRFNVAVEDPDALVESIFAAGLFASRHYPVVTPPADAPVAAGLHSRIVNLFNDLQFDEVRAHAVAAVVTQHVARRPR